jgi:hypothetical protein
VPISYLSWAPDGPDGPDGFWPDPDVLPRLIGRAEALRLGLSAKAVDHRVAAGQWRRLLPRTYLTAGTCTTLDRLSAALIFVGPDAALSGAAALYASEVRQISMPDRILVLVPPGGDGRSRAWVQVRATARPFLPQSAPGPRRVTIARAAADLALTRRRLDDVRALVARVIQDRHCTLDELASELESGPRRGSAHLRTALEEIGWGSASAPEARAARILRRAGIGGFEQNARIDLPGGGHRYLDFYWPALRAALEIDSVEYHFARAQYVATLDRHLQLTALGISVIHRPPSALRDEAGFARDIRVWLAGREADLRLGLGPHPA